MLLYLNLYSTTEGVSYNERRCFLYVMKGHSGQQHMNKSVCDEATVLLLRQIPVFVKSQVAAVMNIKGSL